MALAVIIAVAASCGASDEQPAAPLWWSHLDLELQLPAGFSPAPPPAAVEQPAVLPDPHRSSSRRFAFTSARLPGVTIRVSSERAPASGNLGGALALIRQLAYGSSYQYVADDDFWSLAHRWRRAEFRHVPDADGDPRHVVEFALVARGSLYRVGFHGRPTERPQLQRLAASTMNAARVAGGERNRAGVVSGPTTHPPPTPFATLPELQGAANSVVMLIVADVREGQLQLQSGGSGTIVTDNGVVLSNRHVVHDEIRGRLYDRFFVGIVERPEQPPRFICSGQPGDGVFDQAVDLVLLRCTDDLPGRTIPWQRIEIVDDRKIRSSAPLAIIGFPDQASGRVAVTRGALQPTTGDARETRPYLRTDANISAGMSGGAAVNERGQMIGIPSAYRLQANISSSDENRVSMRRIGILRPARYARRLLQLAQEKWAARARATRPDRRRQDVPGRAE